jgi:HAD superfamily hydrolase (TIGR01490 family)
MAQAAGLTPTGVAAFDFDGTLVWGDSLPRFLARVIGRTAFARVLMRAAVPMLVGYARSGRDGAKAALLVRALRGVESARAVSEGESFAVTLVARIRPRMAARMAWHDEQGHRRILVSASLAVYLEPFGRLAGFEQVIATQLEVGANGRLTGHMAGPNVRAEQKAIRLSRVLDGYPPGPVELWAYGDSAGDRQMLEMADHPTLVGRGAWRRLIGYVTGADGTNWRDARQ